MPPTDNDPVNTDPTNEEIVGYLQRGSMHFCPVLRRHVGTTFTFEFRTDYFQGMTHHFEGTFVDLTQKSKVLCTTTEETFDKYPRAKALKSLLFDQCFPNVEAFAVACRNALGDNIETFDLAGSIFVDGECVTKVLGALDAKATEEKELATEVEAVASEVDVLAGEVEELTDEVKTLKAKLTDVTGILTDFFRIQEEKEAVKKIGKELACTEEVAQVFWKFFCEHQPMQTVS